jgi:methylaspartate ammonia-lyase
VKIVDLLTVPVLTGFYTDDQAAIRAGAEHDGFAYVGEPVTAGFRAVRQAGEALSVMLLLDDGTVEYGDCATVQYGGTAGREPTFSSESAARDIAEYVLPVLRGREITGFRELSAEIDSIETPNGQLEKAIRYGLSQAILAAVAASRRVTMAEVIRDEYDTGAPIERVPIYAQTGDDRYINVDKMILKQVDVLPHGLINTVAKLGSHGELLEDYLRWLVRRIVDLRRSTEYRPRIHIDTYGTIGTIFDGDIVAVADYLAGLGKICAPFELTVEHPLDGGSRDRQIELCAALRAELRARGASTLLAVDEWCNTLEDIRMFVAAGAADVIQVKTPDLGGINDTIEALLLVRDAGIQAYCGGTCNETDRSAQVSAHVAMACMASQILAKPGMGVDEGLMIVNNEMARTAALARSRAERLVIT